MRQELKSIKSNLSSSYETIHNEYQHSIEQLQKLQQENKRLKEDLGLKSSDLMALKAQIVE